MNKLPIWPVKFGGQDTNTGYVLEGHTSTPHCGASRAHKEPGSLDKHSILNCYPCFTGEVPGRIKIIGLRERAFVLV
jgi:hypothetical protein